MTYVSIFFPKVLVYLRFDDGNHYLTLQKICTFDATSGLILINNLILVLHQRIQRCSYQCFLESICLCRSSSVRLEWWWCWWWLWWLWLRGMHTFVGLKVVWGSRKIGMYTSSILQRMTGSLIWNQLKSTMILGKYYGLQV